MRRPSRLIGTPDGRSGRIVSVPDSSKGGVQRANGAGTASPAMTQEILIGDVEIISMLTPRRRAS